MKRKRTTGVGRAELLKRLANRGFTKRNEAELRAAIADGARRIEDLMTGRAKGLNEEEFHRRMNEIEGE